MEENLKNVQELFPVYNRTCHLLVCGGLTGTRG